MKKMLFISKNKVLGQGLLAAIKARPELGLEWLPQFSYSEAAIGADVYHADVVILDVMDGAVADQVLELCRTLRGNSAVICAGRVSGQRRMMRYDICCLPHETVPPSD